MEHDSVDSIFLGSAILIFFVMAIFYLQAKKTQPTRQEPHITNTSHLNNPPEIITMRPAAHSFGVWHIVLGALALSVIVLVSKLAWTEIDNAQQREQLALAQRKLELEKQAHEQQLQLERETHEQDMLMKQEAQHKIETSDSRAMTMTQQAGIPRDNSSSLPAPAPAPAPVITSNYVTEQGTPIYECVTTNGQKTFSNVPCPDQVVQVRTIVIPPTNAMSGGMARGYTPSLSHTPNQTIVVRQTSVVRNTKNTIDCDNAKRMYNFDRGYKFLKPEDNRRHVNDVLRSCGSWPNDLDE